MSLDVFLTTFRGGEEVPVDLNVLEMSLARNGLTGAQTEARTADGGHAHLLVDEDGASFLVDRLTPELSRLVYDVARESHLVVLPADGTPNVFLVEAALAAGLPEDLEPNMVATSAALYERLRASAEARGAHTA
jgi:hypothetical protein